MYYKILNSSINFIDNKYYKFTNINYIAERLFKKKSNINKINFIVEYKNNKIIKYQAKKNNNIIITKEILNKKNGGNNTVNDIIYNKVFSIIDDIINDKEFVKEFKEKIYKVFNNYLEKNPEIITDYLLDPIIELIEKYKNNNKIKYYYFGGVGDIFKTFNENFSKHKRDIIHKIANPIINNIGDYSISLIKKNILKILDNEYITDRIIKEILLEGIIKKVWENKLPKVLNLRSNV